MIYNPAAPSVYGHKFNRIKPMQVLHVPEGSTEPNTTDLSPQLRVIHGELKLYLEGEWISIGGAASTINVRNGVQVDSEGYLTWGGNVDTNTTIKFASGNEFLQYTNDGTIRGTRIYQGLGYVSLEGSGNSGPTNYTSVANATNYQAYLRTTITNASTSAVQYISNIFSNGYTAYMDVATSTDPTVPNMRFEVGGNYFTFKRMRVSDDSEQPMEMYLKNLVTGTGSNILYYNSSTGKVTYGAAPTPTAAGITELTGDVTATGPGSAVATLATVNSNVGAFTNANITVNAKGLVTAAANGTVYTASNGLNKSVNDIQLGGSLTKNTAITSGSFTFQINGASPSGFEGLVKFSSVGGTATNSTLKVANDANNAPAITGQSSSASANCTGVNGWTASGTGVRGTGGGTGIGGWFDSDSGLPLKLARNVASVGNVVPAITLDLGNTVGMIAGTGQSINFNMASTTTGSQPTNKIISKWLDATHATRTSEFSVQGVNSGASIENLLTLPGSGKLQLNKYGIGTFFSAGTPPYSLGVDALGNLVEYTPSAGGGTYTASNGLTMASNNVKLGGTLTEATLINQSSTFGLKLLSSSMTANALHVESSIPSGLQVVYVKNSSTTGGYGMRVDMAGSSGGAAIIVSYPSTTGTNIGISATATAIAVQAVCSAGNAANNAAVSANNQSTVQGFGVYAIGGLIASKGLISGTNSGTTRIAGSFETQSSTESNTIHTALEIVHTTSGTQPLAGFGVGMNFAYMYPGTNINKNNARIQSKFETVNGINSGTTLEFLVNLNGTNALATAFSLLGNGQAQLNKYTLAAFDVTTPDKALGVDSAGKLVTYVPAAGGVSGNIYTQDGTITSSVRTVNLNGNALGFDWLGDTTNTLVLSKSGPLCTFQLHLANGSNQSDVVVFPESHQYIVTNGTNTASLILDPTGATFNCGDGTFVGTLYLAGNGNVTLNAPNFNITTAGYLEIYAGFVYLSGATGPGYVLTDVAGDGILSLQPPSGGGGGVSTGNKAYYVSPSGNNANDGLSPATAWQTIAKVNSFTFAGGDSILFEGGKIFNDAILHCQSGTAGNRITYGSYGSDRATIQSNNAYCITIDDVSYVVVRDLIVQGINHVEEYWGPDGVSIGVGYGTSATVACTDINLINLKIDGYAGGSGIGIWSYATTSTISNILIERCEVSGCCNGIWTSLSETGNANTYTGVTVRNCKAFNNFGVFNYPSNWSGSGIVLSGCNNSIIEDCEAYGNGWRNGSGFGGPHGIWISECSGCTIRNCESHHNGTGVAGVKRLDGGGFDIDGGCQNCVIEYCYSHDNAGCGYALFEYGSPRAAYTGNVIRYNLSVADCRLSSMGAITIWSAESGFTNNRIHNNLIIIDSNKIVAGTTAAMKFISGTYNTLNIVNNIFIVDGAASTLTIGTVGGTWANNITYATNGATLNYSTGCTVANPLLVNHTMEPPTVGAYAQKGVRGSCWNYQLGGNSPAINTGTSTISGYSFPTKDFWGLPAPEGNRNIGPHELVP